MIDLTCKICNTSQFSRKCDLIRHVKKQHDSNCINYNEYYIKYITNVHPLCKECNTNKVVVRKDIISDYCKECGKKIADLNVKKALLDKYSNPEEKRISIAKRKSTVVDRYGVDHISKLDNIKKQKHKTVCDKYNVTSIMQIPTIKNARILSLELNKNIINIKRKLAWTDELKERSKLIRENTNISRYNVKYITQLESIRNSISTKAKLRYSDIAYKQAQIDNIKNKYNVINVSQLPFVKQAIQITSLAKYNSTHYLSSLLRRTREESAGKWIPLSLINEFDKYHRLCITETRKHIKQLMLGWNGKCYYTNQVLLTDKTQYNNPLYRSVDHKISIYDGFMNNVDPVIIGSYNNLCICSRGYNSEKGIKSHESV